MRNTKLRNPGSCDDTREQSPGYNFMVSRIFAYARSANRIRGRRVRVSTLSRCTYHAETCVCKRATPRNARVAPMAVNATRLERSRLRNAVSSQTQRQSRLSATVRRNKNEEKKKERKRCVVKNGPRCEPSGALYHRGCERDVEAHRVGNTIHLLTGRCG